MEERIKMGITQFSEVIGEIGHSMVRCTMNCLGIALNPAKGIIPRCLIFEQEGRSTSMGCAIIGINPGKSRDRERRHYLDAGTTYEAVVEFWKAEISKKKYHRQLRRLVDSLGFVGPILWTELAKCENRKDNQLPPLQTFRTCTHTYLSEELNHLPPDWPIIAVGREAYTALAYRYPTRIVIGVPHVGGSYGLFPELFKKSGDLRPGFRIDIHGLWDGKTGRAVWFNSKTRHYE
jgi:hypothetical protein